MEIKVGEFCRINGEILKVKKVHQTIGEKTSIIEIENRNPKRIDLEKDKHSFNIAELIKVNDFVNGHRVANIKNDEGRIEIGLETDHMINYYIEKEDIRTILTHEQYERNCYTVKEAE